MMDCMQENGHRERMKQRFLKGQFNTFQPNEILELLLSYAIARKDTKPIANQLLEHFGSFHAVLEANVEELTSINGIGEHTAVFLTMMLPLYRHYEKDKLAPKLSLNTFSKIEEYCIALSKGMTTETFFVLCFDAKYQLLSTRIIAQGTVDEVAVYPRQILSLLLRLNAYATVLCHNHPGQIPHPSPQDIALTKTVEQVLQGVGIKLYDHLIVCENQTFSFAKNQLLHLQR